MERRRQVFLGYCHGRNTHQPFTASLTQAMDAECNKDLIGGVIHVGGLYVDDNRNRIAQMFLDCPEGEWLLMLDTDIVFAPETVSLLVDIAEDNECAILSGLYVGTPTEEGLVVPIWFVRGENGQFQSVAKLKTDGPQELDAVGMGVCLIHRNVFESMARAYADDPWHWFGRDIYIDRGIAKRAGEDITFCLRAQALHFQIWGDARINVGHIKERVLTIETLFKENSVQVKPAEAVQHGK